MNGQVWALLRTLCWALAGAALVAPTTGTWLPWVLPKLAWLLQALDGHYRTVSLDTAPLAGEPVIRWVVSQAQSIVVGEHVAMPHAQGRAQATTLLVHLWGPVCLMWAWVMGHSAWPPAHVMPKAAHWTRMLASVLAASVALLGLDVPLVLWAAIWSFHAGLMAPDAWSPLLAWAALMDGGGRWALALGLGMAICRPPPLLEAPQAASSP